jgi:predicted chitinase
MRAHEFVTEKKKRKRKPRWAAYGPGPFGGYGFAVGYSGDAGAGDGGVGEASYDGNIGAMEVFKFMNTASSFEKDLLKKLIAQKAYAKAWALVQGVTGTKLKGKEFEVEEGWKDWLAGAALGSAVAFGGGAAEANIEKVQVSRGDTVYSIAKAFDTTPKIIQKLNKLDKDFTIKPGQTIKVPAGEVVDTIKEPSKEKKAEPEKKKQTKIDPSKTLTGTVHEAALTKAAREAGITDIIELAAFLAQTAHESHNFKAMVEYGDKSYFKQYEPKFLKDKKTGKIIIDPKTKKYKNFNEKAEDLGNDTRGDGVRYKGRGYIQITGKDNYRRVGNRIGVDLVKNPELAEKPEIAAKIAIMYWKLRTQPEVSDFNDVRAVTKTINPGLDQLAKRKKLFQDFKEFKLAQR